MIHDRGGATEESDGLAGTPEQTRVVGLADSRDASSSLLQGLLQVLDLSATDAPLEHTLEALVRTLEDHSGDMRCAVLLVDPQERRLRFAAAPNLPEDYKVAIAPHLQVGPDMAPCAVAAFVRRPIYTRDSATELAQHSAGHIAARNGLRAIWSIPIVSAQGVAVGVLAMHHGDPRLPTDEHVQMIALATHAVRTALKVRAGEETLRAAFEEIQGCVLVINPADRTIRVSGAFAEMLGYVPDELTGRPLACISPEGDLHPPLPSQPGEETTGDRRYRAKDGTVLTVRERCTVRHGQVVSRAERVHPAGDNPLERLSPRERQVLKLVAAGHTSKDIALRLQISSASVDTYRSRLMSKLDLGHRGELIRFAIDHGLTDVL